jgi:cytochrome c553
VIKQLALFVTGTRKESKMHESFMHDALQPADVDRAQAFRDLATYLAQLPRNPQPEQSDGAALALGERDYRRGCARCHGSDGAGSEHDGIPAIGGQGYSYLLARLRSFSSGRLTHPPLADSPAALSAEEQSAVADYLSRLNYLAAAEP